MVQSRVPKTSAKSSRPLGIAWAHVFGGAGSAGHPPMKNDDSRCWWRLEEKATEGRTMPGCRTGRTWRVAGYRPVSAGRQSWCWAWSITAGPQTTGVAGAQDCRAAGRRAERKFARQTVSLVAKGRPRLGHRQPGWAIWWIRHCARWASRSGWIDSVAGARQELVASGKVVVRGVAERASPLAVALPLDRLPEFNWKIEKSQAPAAQGAYVACQ